MKTLRVVYSSLHNLDLNGETPANKVIPEDFDSYMESYIQFATAENPSSREYTSVDNNRTVMNCIIQIFSLLQQGYERPFLEGGDDAPEDEVLTSFTSIAKKLLDTEKLVQERVGHLTTVQKGSIVQALIEDNYEYKYVVAKVEHSEWIDGETFQKNFGFPSENRKVWKSAVFVIGVEEEDIVFKSIKAYVNNSAVYWTKEFLEVKEANSNTTNTRAVLNAVENVLKPIKSKSPQDYYNLRNSAIRELQTDQLINYPDMVNRLLDNYNPAGEDVNVITLKADMLSQSDGRFDTQFHSDPNVVKKNKKVLVKVSPFIDVVIKDSLPDWKGNFKIHKKSDGSNYLMVRCDDPHTLRAFPVDE